MTEDGQTQVVGPGGGTVTAIISYASIGGNLTFGDTYSMHVYLTPENNTKVFGPTTDWQHFIVDRSYLLTVTQPTSVSYPGAIYNSVSFYAPPTSIPANGFLTAVLEYSSNCTGSVIIHLEVRRPAHPPPPVSCCTTSVPHVFLCVVYWCVVCVCFSVCCRCRM